MRYTLCWRINPFTMKFFDQIKFKPGWKYLGRKDNETTTGAVVQTAPGITIRVYHYTGTNKGGIVQKTFDPERRQPVYKCLIDNKTPDELNHYITNNL